MLSGLKGTQAFSLCHLERSAAIESEPVVLMGAESKDPEDLSSAMPRQGIL